MTQQEEQYVHFVSCTDSLNTAWWLLNEIKQSPRDSRTAAAFQFAIVEYAKPYRTSYGTTGKHRLDDAHVPLTHRTLHDRLLATRDQRLAHSDLTVMEAKVHVANTSIGQRAFIVQNLLYGAAELSNIDSIIELIEQTLVSMYAESDRLEKQLPLSTGAV